MDLMGLRTAASQRPVAKSMHIILLSRRCLDRAEMLSLSFAWILALANTAIFRVASARITDVVLFGDSYTGAYMPSVTDRNAEPMADQSRSHSISNGTYPGKDYQEVYPPVSSFSSQYPPIAY